MAIRKVAQIGHPILRRVADPVDPTLLHTVAFQQLCEDLLETMDEYDGAGLAAPQVHVSLRVVVLTLSKARGPEFLVNPVITPLTEETTRTYEGCLSVEGFRAAVDRPKAVRVEALGRDGAPKVYELEGFPAVVVQHECDHLDGVLYVDRAAPRTLSTLREYRRWGPLGEDGLPVEEAVDELDDDEIVDEQDEDFDEEGEE